MLQQVLAVIFKKQPQKKILSFLIGVSVLLASSLLAGCETVVEIDVPPHTPKLSLQYNLNTLYPNQHMYVGRSQSALSGNDLWENGTVRNASVTIKDASGTVRQSFTYESISGDPLHGNYKPSNPFTPLPGQTYTLSVSAPGFEAVHATATIPVAVPITSVAFTPDARSNSYEFSGNLRIQFSDLLGQNNYYRLSAELQDAEGNLQGHVYSSSESGEIFGEDIDRILLGQVFDDGWANQGLITFSGKVSSYTNMPGNVYLEVTLEHITHDLFLYERSRQNYQEDNPFAEPINLHSNIQNGYGNFGAINSTKFRIRIQ